MDATAYVFDAYGTLFDVHAAVRRHAAAIGPDSQRLSEIAGHRLSTGTMEEVLASHPAVAECAVIGVADALKGQLPVGFVVLKAGVKTAPGVVETEAVDPVRAQIGPVAALKTALTVARLPKTRSAKIRRGTMRQIADGEDYKIPATIDDPAAIDEIAAALRARGDGG